MFNSPRLRDLFGGVAVADLTAAELSAAVAGGVAEMEELDWKQDPYEGKGRGKEIAKDVAAFANHSGGIIVLGVAEDRATGQATKMMPFTVSPDQVESKIRAACADNIYPRIVDLDVRAIAASEADTSAGWFLVVSVGRSRDAPHAVAPSQDHTLMYPIRDGQRTHYLREPEVAARYRNRFTAATDVAAAATSLLRSGLSELSSSDAVWVSVACSPSSPGSRPSGAQARAREVGFMQSWSPPAGSLADRVDSSRPRVAVQRTRFLHHSSGQGVHRAAYVELAHDGGGFVAQEVSPETQVRTPVGFNNYYGDAAIVGVDRIEWALFTALALLVEHAIDTAAAGELELAASVHTGPHRYMAVCVLEDQPAVVCPYRVDEDMQPLSITATRPTPTAVATVPITGGRDYRLIATAAYTLGTDLLAAFAVDNPRLFEPDGWGHPAHLGPLLTGQAAGYWMTEHLNVDTDLSAGAAPTD